MVESLDFYTRIPGHGPNGRKKDATDHRLYLTDLYNQVLKAAREGKSAEDLASAIDLTQYSQMGMYKTITMQRRNN